MADSALLKIDQAAKHISNLDEVFREKRPFVWVVETNTKTGERTLQHKKNESVIELARLISGDAVHNLRSALDHAYWEIVSPLCTTDRERKKLQFPFAANADRLDGIIQGRLAHYAGTGFYFGMRSLRPYPYAQRGGNELLYLIDEMDILDKHKLLVPTVDYGELSGDMIRQFVPDFNVISGSGKMGYTSCIFSWRVTGVLPLDQRGELKPPTTNIFQRELDMPIDIVFRIGPYGRPRPVIPTLNTLVDVTRQTIKIMRLAAASM